MTTRYEVERRTPTMKAPWSHWMPFVHRLTLADARRSVAALRDLQPGDEYRIVRVRTTREVVQRFSRSESAVERVEVKP